MWFQSSWVPSVIALNVARAAVSLMSLSLP